MSREERHRVLAEVDEVHWGKRRRLRELGIPKSTYYRWRGRQSVGRMEDLGRKGRSWNRLGPEEEAVVLCTARQMPELAELAVGGLAHGPEGVGGLGIHGVSAFAQRWTGEGS